MMLAALANPLIKHDTQPAFVWLSTWLTPLIVASVAFGLYFLVARKRARATWPHGFFITAWVLVAITLATPYIQKAQQGQAALKFATPAPAVLAPAPVSETAPDNPFKDPNYGKELLQKQL
ncbi:hypothetical protein ASF19_20200 [Acidovorax sp. Leaf84]|uniref:hypothetical protein n=1 Tax=Acidovorax sp. Leaf84 TaxID=1736240 RepID=UPI0006F2A266|nr:hypothetical protein [Acidovorax sp. Leaf84]KQO38099.1 hypothetical protein ASF19_20200 [Acidovorax sp. Leaf84]